MILEELSVGLVHHLHYFVEERLPRHISHFLVDAHHLLLVLIGQLI